MFIWIVPLVVLAGIFGVAALVYFARSADRVRLESNAEALKMWQDICPSDPASNVLLEPSGIAALVDLDDGGTGILWASGAKVEGRILQAGALSQEGALLRIDLPDYKTPHLDVIIDEPMVRRIWLETLKTVLTERS